MRLAPVVLALAAVLFLSGCGRSESDLYGTWTADVDKMLAEYKASTQYKETPEDMRDAGEKLFRSMMSDTEFTFSEGKLSCKLGGNPNEATWKVLSKDGDKWTIQMKVKNKDTNTGTLEWVDDNHLKLDLKEDNIEGTFHLVRKK